MRKAILVNLAFALVTACVAQAGTHPATAKYAPNEIIVKFHKTAADAIEEHLELKKSAHGLTLSRNLDDLNARCRMTEIKPVFKNFEKHRQRLRALAKKDTKLLTKRERHILKRLKRAPIGAKVPDLSRIYKIELDLEPGQSLEEVAAAYNSDPDVEYAELNYIVSINLTPDDPLYSIQWPLHNTGQMYPESGNYNHPPGTPDCDIDAPEAWDICTGSPEVIIAVVDTGVDYTHRDLQGNMWTDPNGCYGYDFINDDNDPMDDHGHGTHCSGTIAGIGNNGLDITGVCWSARVMALKFLGSDGLGDTADAVTAFYYAVENGADVVSNSWGGGGYFGPAQDAIDYAYSQGVLMVAAAGNDDTDEPQYPSNYNHMISVAATNSNDQRAPFSNYGHWVDIAAPGVDVLSLRATGTPRGTVYDDYTTIMSGTSMACPHVAGVTGLIISHYADTGIDEIIIRLLQAADDVSELNPGYEGLLGTGRVNAYEALTKTQFDAIIELNSDVYSCNDSVSIKLLDLDLKGHATQDVIVTGDGGDFETVTLVADVNQPYVFTGEISTSAGPVTVEDGTLQLSHEEVIIAIYEDDSDRTGQPAIVEAMATLDCQGPVISEVQLEQLASAAAAITFETDEPATMFVRCGLECGGPYPVVAQEGSLAEAHTAVLMGLAGQTKYYFVVEANDALGNQTTDDNAGACYSFTTTQRPTTVGLHVPDEYPTIQAAIDTATDGETVWLALGTYTGPGNRDIDFGGKAITVGSEEGPYFTIIDCDANASDMHRAFNFVGGEGPNSVLDGLTIINGYGPQWGDFNGSYYDDLVGGAVYCGESSPTITNCHFKNNRTVEYGGAIFSHSGNPTISNCVFATKNRAGRGGAIYTCQNSPLITDCIFAGNKALHEGGAIHSYRASPVIRNCTITGNIASMHYGGGIHLESGSATVENCLIAKNAAAWFGGGVYCALSPDDSAKLINCTIAGNWAGGSGGGLFADLDPNEEVMVTNCILWGHGQSQIGIIGPKKNVVVTYCDVQGGYAGEGNINADPCFADAGSGNYRLAHDSPCIDIGTNEPTGGLPPTDLEGTPRPMDGDFDGDSVVDMGAYEYHVPSGTPAIGVGTHEIEFSAVYGGPNPDDQILSIWNGGEGTLVWEISEECPWLEVSPLSGEFDDVVLSVDIASVPHGVHSCVVTISAAGAANTPRIVQVNLSINTILHVPTEDYPTIQAAIDAVIDMDVVIVADGVYTGQGNRDINFGGKAITVRSENGPAGCIIDCQGTVTEPHRAFYFHSGESSLSVVEGFTITNGYADWGGGIYCRSSSPTIKNCTFSTNTASVGGAMENEGSRPIVTNCIFTGNTATLSGGGVFNDDSSAQVINCIFAGNRTDMYGGGISNQNCSPMVTNCSFNANTAEISGGGMFNLQSSPRITNCILWGDAPEEIGLLQATPAVSYSDVQGGWSGAGNIDADPCFADPCSGDYHLCWGSPCRDAGDPNGDYEDQTDIDGDPRVLRGRVDMGADEAPIVLWYVEAAGGNDDNNGLSPENAFASIQRAIDTAKDDDVVIVADGIYSGDGNRDIDFNGKPITVRSANGPANCIIDCQGTEAEPHRGFYFHSAESPLSVVKGFTITNGYAQFGGGIATEYSSPTVIDCFLWQNVAGWDGGGMENFQSSPVVKNCVFSDNSTLLNLGFGGGIDNYGSSPVITNCTFHGNSAYCGGGIYASLSASTQVINCILWGDTATDGPEIGGDCPVSYSDIQGGYAGQGNIGTDPCFAEACNGDYHLLPSSPAIDAGDPSFDWTNEPWPNGGRVNMGAYGNTTQATQSRADFKDLAMLAAYWLQYEPTLDVAPGPGGDGIINFLDFGILADYWAWEQ